MNTAVSTGGQDEARAVALQPDGKTVVAGDAPAGRNSNNIAVVRYNKNGSLDTTFGGDGTVITELEVGSTASDVAIQSDGKIVVAGSTFGLRSRFAVVRYNPDGTLDTTFSGDSIQTTGFGDDDAQAEAMALQPDGRIALAGTVFLGGDGDFALVRYNPDGSLDTTFGTDGRVTIPIGPGRDTATAITLQGEKIVVAGFAQESADPGADNDFAVARYNANGSLDTTFSGDGFQTTDFFGSSDRAFAVVIGPDSRITVAGSAQNGQGNADFAIARYIGDATPPRATKVVPAENSTGIAPGTNVIASFSEKMRPGTINANTVKLFKAGTTIAMAAAVSYDAATRRATLNPDANLQRGTKYKAVVTTGVRDLAGNRLDQNATVAGNQSKAWFFTVRN